MHDPINLAPYARSGQVVRFPHAVSKVRAEDAVAEQDEVKMDPPSWPIVAQLELARTLMWWRSAALICGGLNLVLAGALLISLAGDR